MLLLESDTGVGLDIALGALDFEARSIERASWWSYQSHRKTWSAEDLIVHKAFASRDLDHIFMAQGRKLNVAQILDGLRPLVELKEDATILPRLEAMMRKRDVID